MSAKEDLDEANSRIKEATEEIINNAIAMSMMKDDIEKTVKTKNEEIERLKQGFQH